MAALVGSERRHHPGLGLLRRAGLAAILVLTAASHGAFGAELSFDLSSRTELTERMDASASNALWDPVRGRITVPFSALHGGVHHAVPVGDGSLGDFLNGPASPHAAITVTGATIAVDTDLQPVDADGVAGFQFASFRLDAGYTLVARGSQPLVLRALGDVTIAGTIDADGAAGGSNASGAVGVGGTPGPGGFAGGAGSSLTDASGQSGTPSGGGTRPNGGGGGQTGSTGAGGGGGCIAEFTNAAHRSVAGQGSATGPGARAICPADESAAVEAFDPSGIHGGGGGGGGGGVTSTRTGAGGGGGGGAVRVIALGDLSLAGTIRARGGAGGTYPDVVSFLTCPGGGGGGAGGAVWLQSAGTVGGGGSVLVDGGASGLSATCTGDPQNGGRGSHGLVRIDQSGGAAAAITVAPTALQTNRSTQANPDPPGTPYVLLTRPIAFSDRYYRFATPVETRGCGTDGTLAITYEADDDESFATPRSVDGSRIGELDGRTWLRVRVEISPTGANPPCLEGLRIPYEEREKTAFLLEGTGLFCGTLASGGVAARGGQPRRDGRADLALIALVALIATRAGRDRRSQTRRSFPRHPLASGA